MSYVQGFVLAVPTANRRTYIAHAEAALPLFKEFGATRLVEGWGDDVPDGKINDFKGAVQARPDETVLFSWIEFPDKATCDAAGQKMMNDPRMESLGPMPFDGKRMIYAGFDPVLDEGPGGRMGYVDGYLIPVLPARKTPMSRWRATWSRSSSIAGPPASSNAGASMCRTARSPISGAPPMRRKASRSSSVGSSGHPRTLASPAGNSSWRTNA